MLEKEIKILEIDKVQVIQKLENIWAEKTFEWFIHDVYYDFINWKNHKMNDNKRLFRVRKKWETHMYTIKRKRNKKVDWGEKGVKIADEWEREITDVESFSKVLEKYGMQKVREKKKYRISYALQDFEFDIDDYEEIPTLMEIEAHTKEDILDMIKKLDLQNHIQKDFGSRKLYEYYKKEYSYL